MASLFKINISPPTDEVNGSDDVEDSLNAEVNQATVIFILPQLTLLARSSLIINE